MASAQFDQCIRSLTDAFRRRDLLQGLVAAAGLVATNSPWATDAKNKRRRKRNKKSRKNKKSRVNQFGCLDIGQPCRGNSTFCCSGVCQGAKPKQGERDRSTCVAHDTGSCQAGASVCSGTAITCTSTSGESGLCFTTTGNAGFCSATSDCFPCTKDADCQAVCGAAAACVRCEEFCPDTGGTGCAGTDQCPGFPPD